MRIVHKTGTSDCIKAAISDFFGVVQGGAKGKESALAGAQKLITSAIDGLLGTGSGSSNEISNFVVLFLNYSFVRVDYMAYYYNVEGSGILKSGQEGGFCCIMDVSIIPHDQIKSEEVTFLLSQALHMDPNENSYQKDLQVLMDLEIALAEERLITRKINDENATLEDIRRLKAAMVSSKNDKADLVEKLPNAVVIDPMERIKLYEKYWEWLSGDDFKDKGLTAEEKHDALEKVIELAKKKDEKGKETGTFDGLDDSKIKDELKKILNVTVS